MKKMNYPFNKMFGEIADAISNKYIGKAGDFKYIAEFENCNIEVHFSIAFDFSWEDGYKLEVFDVNKLILHTKNEKIPLSNCQMKELEDIVWLIL